MKQQLLILAISCMASTAHAQLRVATNGNVAVQTGETPLSAISIGDAGKSNFYFSASGTKGSVNSSVIGSTQNWSNAGQFFSALNPGNNFCIGLRAETRDLNNQDGSSHRSFGIMGLAGNATTGWNYGVYGKLLGKNRGAGVYGTTVDDNGICLDNRYAGYFNGLVGINGNLNVDGAINGVIIGSSVSNTGLVKLQDAEPDVAVDKLAGLTAIPYYKNTGSMVTPQSSAEGDTIVAPQELSQIAVQNMTKMHYALSAEELENVYPDLVYTQDDGTKGINYMEMIPTQWSVRWMNMAI